jgi:isopenicillin N synthase-like dioxygenase
VIPTVDIHCGDAAQHLHQAFTTVGFAYVQGLPSSGAPFRRALIAAQNLFQLSRDQLDDLGYDLDTNTGFERFLESFRPGTPYDLHEAMTWGPFRNYQDRWPSKDFLAEAQAWTQACLEDQEVMLSLLEQALDQAPGSLRDLHRGSTTSTLRWIHYPPWSGEILPGQMRGGAHTDIGTITLLYQNDVAGLEVKTRSGEWVSVPPQRDACVVNVGDLLQRWTNDLYISTRHRVSNAHMDLSRLSFPHFIHPHPQILITSLTHESRYEPVIAGEYFRAKLARSYQK